MRTCTLTFMGEFSPENIQHLQISRETSAKNNSGHYSAWNEMMLSPGVIQSAERETTVLAFILCEQRISQRLKK